MKCVEREYEKNLGERNTTSLTNSILQFRFFSPSCFLSSVHFSPQNGECSVFARACSSGRFV